MYKFDDEIWTNVHDSAKDMMAHMMVVDPSQRWTARQLLDHPWFKVGSPQRRTLICHCVCLLTSLGVWITTQPPVPLHPGSTSQANRMVPSTW
jgi:serine/threonine protein kinase